MLKRMKTDPIMEEAWKVKDDLARASGYDIDRFFAQLREWADANVQGSAVRTAEELRALAARASVPPGFVLEEERGTKP